MSQLKRQPSVVFDRLDDLDLAVMGTDHDAPSENYSLTEYGRRFGRSVYAFPRLTVFELLLPYGPKEILEVGEVDGQLQELNMSESEEDSLGWREFKRHLYHQLLHMVPKLEERLANASSRQDISNIANPIQKGVAFARRDDAKGLRTLVLEWIAPPGVAADPPLDCTKKTSCGFNHALTGAMLCPVVLNWSDFSVQSRIRSGALSGDHWPSFVFENYALGRGNPWEGFFRSSLLVMAYKHIFSTPTSPRNSTCQPDSHGRNEFIQHDLNQVTLPELAYVAAQVRHALSSSTTFLAPDAVTSSRNFYEFMIHFFYKHERDHEIGRLLSWWDRQIFPSTAIRGIA